ncbi:hypothetical protein DITRI_Ditri15bG0078900 [Diplodiscus trichospermus]
MENVIDSNSYIERPNILVINGDGNDTPGLQALVSVLISTHQFNVLVCPSDVGKYACFLSLICLDSSEL